MSLTNYAFQEKGIGECLPPHTGCLKNGVDFHDWLALKTVSQEQHMIEGLKVTVTGAELRDLCLRRCEYHRQRAKVYAEQKTNMEANEIEGMNYSGGDPRKVLKDRMELHEGEAEELQFLADHLILAEEYRLDRSDLHKLGISKTAY